MTCTSCCDFCQNVEKKLKRQREETEDRLREIEIRMQRRTSLRFLIGLGFVTTFVFHVCCVYLPTRYSAHKRSFTFATGIDDKDNVRNLPHDKDLGIESHLEGLAPSHFDPSSTTHTRFSREPSNRVFPLSRSSGSTSISRFSGDKNKINRQSARSHSSADTASISAVDRGLSNGYSYANEQNKRGSYTREQHNRGSYTNEQHKQGGKKQALLSQEKKRNLPSAVFRPADGTSSVKLVSQNILRSSYVKEQNETGKEGLRLLGKDVEEKGLEPLRILSTHESNDTATIYSPAYFCGPRWDIDLGDTNVTVAEVRMRLGNIFTFFGMNDVGFDDSVLNDVPNNSQKTAVCWLLNDDILKGMEHSPETLLQRYSIVVLLLEMAPDKYNIDIIHGWGDNECLWLDHLKCNAEGYLYNVSLSDAGLTGSIPEELFNLKHIENLDLKNNAVEGSLLPHVKHLYHLTSLDLGGNALTGTLPTQMGHLEHLSFIRLRDNDMSGTVPTELGRLSKLSYLDLSSNDFSGAIPSEIFTSSLQSLQLDQNAFHGSLPTQIGRLVDIKYLDVNNNKLTGTLPSQMNLLEKIDHLSLCHNEFTGEVNSALDGLNYTFLAIDSNSFTGSLPEVGSGAKVTGYYTSHNSFTGSVPHSLHHAKKDAIICVGLNGLSGSIPDSLCHNRQVFADSVPHFSLEPKVACRCCQPWSIFTAPSFAERHLKQTDLSCDSMLEINVTSQVSFFMKLRDVQTTNIIMMSQQIIEGIKQHNTYRGCVPVTSCFELLLEGKFLEKPSSLLDVNVSVAYRGREISDMSAQYATTIEGWVRRFYFGYAAESGSMEANTCDEIHICGQVIRAHDVQRARLNVMTGASEMGPSVVAVKDTASSLTPWRKAICAVLDEGDRFPLEDGSLLQRYIAALLFYNNHAWAGALDRQFPSEHVCDWVGIYCRDHKFVSVIDMSSSEMKLTGTLPKEIWLIQSLERLDLSNNDLEGPVVISDYFYSTSLTHVHLGMNRITGSLPWILRLLDVPLEDLDLASNRLTGSLPFDSSMNSKAPLKLLNLTGNILKGTVPARLPFPSMETLDLSLNYFSGALPATFLDLTQMRHLELSSNKFSSTLPVEILAKPGLQVIRLSDNKLQGVIKVPLSTSLEHIVLDGNKFSGEIPKEFGSIAQLKELYLDHNSFQGTVPTTIANLDYLVSFRIHSNELSGKVVEMPHLARLGGDAFIADCGRPSLFDASRALLCPSCTICCNAQGECQSSEKRSNNLIKMTFWILLAVNAFLLAAVLIAFLVYKKSNCTEPAAQEVSSRSLCGEDSVYSFALTNNWICWMIYLITLVFQWGILFIFITVAEFNADGSDWIYTMTCPSGDVDCQDSKNRTWLGWTVSVLLLVIILLPDCIKSLHLILRAVVTKRPRLFFSGSAIFSTSALTLFTSVSYNAATAMSNSAMIINAAILAFVIDLDEWMYMICVTLFPQQWEDWMDLWLLKDDDSDEKAQPQTSEVSNSNSNHQASIEEGTRSGMSNEEGKSSAVSIETAPITEHKSGISAEV